MHNPGKLENLYFACSMLREVRQQTKAAGEELLTYLIDMAYLEANDRVRTIVNLPADTAALNGE